MEPTNQKYFEYVAIIDAAYYMLKRLSQPLTPSPIEMMVDIATGFSEQREKNRLNDAISLVKTIIRYKRRIGIDFSNDVKTLEALKELKRN